MSKLNKLLILPFVLLLSTLLPAQSSGNINPVGQYEFRSVQDGKPFTVKFRIKGEPGNYSGELKASHIPREMKFTDVATDKNKMILVVDTRNTVFVMRAVFDGNKFKGNWVVGTDSGELEGTKNSDSYETEK